MSVKLQSNYLYNGSDFLDQRQSYAKTTDDLKTWFDEKEDPEDIVVIPEGFEVRVEGQWYVYSPTRERNPETGYFHPRINEESVKDLLPEGLIKIGSVLNTINLN